MNRKAVVEILTEHFKVKSKYLGAPTFAYEIAAENEIYTIDREGNITAADGREVILRDLLEPQETEPEEAEIHGEPEPLKEVEVLEEPEAKPANEITNFEVKLPMERHSSRTLRNLVNMIYSKQALIKKTFGLNEDIVTEDFSTSINEINISTLEDFTTALKDIGEKRCPGIGFNFQENTINFKFYKGAIDSEMIKAYTQFVAIVNENAKAQKFASPKVKPTDNEKYTFRTWLLRLGMIGEEYKLARKLLLQNLSGNSAFRKPVKEEA